MNPFWIHRSILGNCIAVYTTRTYTEWVAMVRVIVTDMPPLLRAIVMKILTNEPDLKVYEAENDELALVDAIRTYRPHVLVTASVEDGTVRPSLMYAHPRMKVLTIDGDGRHANLHELSPNRLALGEVSPESLVAAIRGAGQESSLTGEE